MSHQFVLEPLDTFTRSIDQAVELAVRHNWVSAIPKALLFGDEVSLAADQTPIRDQGDRGTCWAFAGIAALEAAYKRSRGLNLDLSEQYLFHVPKANDSDFGNHSLMGAQGSSDIVKHLERVRVPEESDAPYRSDADMIANIPGAAALAAAAAPGQEQRDNFEFSPLHIPYAARAKCRFGANSTGVITNFTTTDIEDLIRARKEVVVNVVAPGGGHTLVIVGFSRIGQYFLAKNSWGGDQLTKIAYANDRTFTLDTKIAHYIVDVIDPAIDVRSQWLGQWNMDHDGWRGQLTIRRLTDFRSATDSLSAAGRTKLGSYYLNGDKHDVDGYFDDAGRTVHLHVADIGGGGQDFTMSMFENAAQAAGDTTWASIPFGAQIRRDAIEPAPAQEFDRTHWVGTWDVNHDGWGGSLTVGGFNPATGAAMLSYVRSSGEVRPISGAARAAQPHILDFTINFNPDNQAQQFTLHHHTHEAGVASGQTTWSGMRFGVVGRTTTG